MRVGTGVTGLVLLVGGTVALCLGLGVFGTGAAGSPVISDETSRFVTAHEWWFWPAVAGVSLAVALAGLGWLLVQARTALSRRRALVDGATRMLSRAAARDLIEDTRRIPGVQGARIRFTGTMRCPRLLMTVVCAEETDLATLYTALGDGPVERYRVAMGIPDLPVIIRFKVVYREARLA